MEAMTAAAGMVEALELMKTAGGKLVEFGMEKFKGQVDQRVTRWKNALNAKVLAERIDAIVKVKTFWSFDKEVSLYDFYYPPALAFFHPTPKPVNGLKDFGARGNFVIQGTVGQGKSIFLRHLCGQEFRAASTSGRIPIFAELKRVQAAHSLKDVVFDALERFGFEVDDALFDLYAESGSIVLLLDGFDEIAAPLVPAAIDYLEGLATRYKALQIFVTARPDAGIQHSSLFRITRLTPLAPQDHAGFLDKVCQDGAQAARLHQAILHSTVEIQNLLTTPLLMTLMVVLYGSHEDVPKTVPAFYEQLFEMLFYRHDRSKPGFVRQRHTRLDDQKVKHLFEAFCFHVRARQATLISSELYRECIEAAARTCNYEVDPRAFKDEITKVACLVQEEGFHLSFIHKSVAEFHAAAFIRHSSDEVQESFYKELRNARHWANWRQELRFLEEIDPYRFSRFFFRPAALSALADLRVDAATGKTQLDRTVLAGMLGRIRIKLVQGTGQEVSCTAVPHHNFATEAFLYDVAAEVERALAEAREDAQLAQKIDALLAGGDGWAGVPLDRMLERPGLDAIVLAAYEHAARRIVNRLKVADQYVTLEQRKISVIRAVSRKADR